MVVSRARACCLAIALMAGMPSVARAEAPGDRIVARKLGGEALDLYKAKDFASALSRFEEADRLTPAPTLKLHAARCLERLGRWREAVARYRETIALELKPNSPRVHVDAREDAVRELAALLEVAPRLVVEVTGAARSVARIVVDGAPMGEGPGQTIVLDAGEHAVRVSGGGFRVDRRVTVARGRATRLNVDLSEDGADAIEMGGDASASRGAGLSLSSRRALRTTGWTLLGVGTAGLVLGSVATVALFDDRDRAASLCPEGRCPSEDSEAVAVATRFNRERIAASAGWIGGGALAAAGASLLIAAAVTRGGDGVTDVHASRAGLVLVPMVGAGFVGLSGAF